MQRLLNCVIAAWAGSLWTVCAIVAPSMFSLAADRHQAGEIAGYFFRLQTWLGLGFGAVVWVLLLRGAAAWRKPFDSACVLATIVAPLISELGLRSAMSSARAANDMQRFGLLHALSAALFLIAALAALAMAWRLTAPNVSR